MSYARKIKRARARSGARAANMANLGQRGAEHGRWLLNFHEQKDRVTHAHAGRPACGTVPTWEQDGGGIDAHKGHAV